MKNSGIWLLFVPALALLLAACESQAPVQQRAAASAMSAAGTATSAINRYSGTRRVTKDGVEYFCERPRPTGSNFIALREQCYTEAQLKAVRERDQDFVRRQQSISLQTNTTAVTRTAISP